MILRAEKEPAHGPMTAVIQRAPRLFFVAGMERYKAIIYDI